MEERSLVHGGHFVVVGQNIQELGQNLQELVVNIAFLLDVDGVLAPLGQKKHRDRAGWPERSWACLHEGFDMWLSTAVGEAINELAAKYSARLVWCTTWLCEPEDLAGFGAYLGLAPETPPFPAEGPWGGEKGRKRRIAREVGQSDTTAVWFDDDPYSKVHPNVHLVRTNGAIGITSFEIHRAQHLLDKLINERTP